MRALKWIAGLVSVAGLAVACQSIAQTAPSRPAITDWEYANAGSRSRIVTPDTPKTALENGWLDELRASAEHGTNLDSMVAYAAVLEYGTPPQPKDRAGALDLYEKTADRGNIIGREKMCIAYLMGDDRKYDPNKAYGSYCGKLEHDDPVFIFSVAYDYEHGLSGPKDEATALGLYAQAAEKGNREAMNAVALLALAKGKPKNAAVWFRQAIAHGSIEAMDHLAQLLETGLGVDKDMDEAWWLYVNAARFGDAQAAVHLAALGPREPLLRVRLLDVKKTLMNQTVTDTKGTRNEPFDILKLAKQLSDYYPPAALQVRQEGQSTTNCYINGKHEVDVCMPMDDYPIGFGFSETMQALFNGRLTAAEVDADGLPTAHSAFLFTFHWRLR